ncbi:helix-turn-helix domain-containing protein [Sphingomicrobium astaxanthinifaciens]|uniref:helix-turn-helix domain-containing protein n=1 Tax=Sphingomicrobium astaxanthinifaciens TaxID=1227949 RepID=UPI001FCBA1DE|nr:helix-turn-helix transcriptional regulator [Sphingomicrobium astaxanthinifaciens]MCJ7421566.1 helix-turn-helix transcriptional regulator [Sphingomicrobium astaxanthinifaciens]
MSEQLRDEQDASPEARLARLTEGQRECLRLVAAHHNSKEIAAKLGISPHTVDQRIRIALHTLGVSRRQQAARLLADHEAAPGEDPYQRLICQSPYIPDPAEPVHSEAAIGKQIRHVDRAGSSGPALSNTEQDGADTRFSLPLPFATRQRPRNEMGIGMRLLWIALIALGATFSAGMYMAGLESLARLLSS